MARELSQFAGQETGREMGTVGEVGEKMTTLEEEIVKLKEKMTYLEEENVKLKEKMTTLEEKNIKLKEKMEALEKEGVKIRRSGTGGEDKRKNKGQWDKRLRKRKGGVTRAGG